MWLNSQKTAELVTFPGEVFNGKLNSLSNIHEREGILSQLLLDINLGTAVENLFTEINLCSKKGLLLVHITLTWIWLKIMFSRFPKVSANTKSTRALFLLGTLMLKCSYSGVLCSNKGLIKEPTYFKNLDRPTGIDLILKNHPKCF